MMIFDIQSGVYALEVLCRLLLCALEAAHNHHHFVLIGSFKLEADLCFDLEQHQEYVVHVGGKAGLLRGMGWDASVSTTSVNGS